MSSRHNKQEMQRVNASRTAKASLRGFAFLSPVGCLLSTYAYWRRW